MPIRWSSTRFTGATLRKGAMTIDLFTATILLLQASVPSLLEDISFQSILLAALIFAAAWLLVRWSGRLFGYLGGRSTRGRYFFRRLEPLVRILIWVQAAYVTLALLSPSREAFLALKK